MSTSMSDDNAFTEALFRTAKHGPDFPIKGVTDLNARLGSVGIGTQRRPTMDGAFFSA
jgi:hypothetical protein